MRRPVLGEPLFAHPTFALRSCARTQEKRQGSQNHEKTDSQEHIGSGDKASAYSDTYPGVCLCSSEQSIPREARTLGGMNVDYSKAMFAGVWLLTVFAIGKERR
jgi:hypothetical protein